MVIIRDQDFAEANKIFSKYSTKPVYSSLIYEGNKYVVFEKGVAAALIEVDIKFGYDFKEGRIVARDKIQ